MPDYIIRPLQSDDDCSIFNCGKPVLNNWLNRNAWRNQKSGASRTYIISTEDGMIRGYMSLATGEIHRKFLPKARQRNMPDPVPVILLAQLAVDQNYQGEGLAGRLLVSSFKHAIAVSRTVGSFALLTHPLDDNARAFYEHWGFASLLGDPKGAMFVRIKDLEAELS